MDERQLSLALVEFARTLTSDFSIQTILDHLVEHVVKVVGVTGAGVLLMDGDERHRFVAATDEVILRIETLQIEQGEGPCLLAYRTGEHVAIPDLSVDTAFPSFSPLAVRAGLAAAYSFPLRLDETVMGALELYSERPQVLSGPDLAAAQVLADVAAAYLLNADARKASADSILALQTESLHDTLTGLPNRVNLQQRLDGIRSRLPGSTAGILYLDIDRFKTVNDTFGHKVGDALLVEFARRVELLVPSGGLLARLAGDEFVLLCDHVADVSAVELVASRVVDAVRAPFHVDGTRIAVNVSVGVAFVGPQHDSVDDAMLHADHAMYRAKQQGGARHVVASLGDPAVTDRRRLIDEGLWDAIRRHTVELVYQPMVDSGTGLATGAEASLAWDHPVLGRLGHRDIVAAAHRVGMTMPLLSWELRAVLGDLARWDAARPGAPRLVAGINVDLRDLLQPDVVRVVSEVIATSSIGYNRLSLEVTEDIYLADDSAAAAVLQQFRALGVAVALDQFGVGFSSLGDLRSFAVNAVKIGPALVHGAEASSVDASIVSAIVALCRDLDMTVVADGIETADQLRVMRDLGCHTVQGSFWSTPLSPSRMTALFAERADAGAAS